MKDTLDLLKAYIKRNKLSGMEYIKTFDDGSGSVSKCSCDSEIEDSRLFEFVSIEELEDKLKL